MRSFLSASWPYYRLAWDLAFRVGLEDATLQVVPRSDLVEAQARYSGVERYSWCRLSIPRVHGLLDPLMPVRLCLALAVPRTALPAAASATTCRSLGSYRETLECSRFLAWHSLGITLRNMVADWQTWVQGKIYPSSHHLRAPSLGSVRPNSVPTSKGQIPC